MHVLIVGSGIAGLACAIGIRKSGHSVTALERAQVAKESGGGLSITPNATRALQQLGVLPRVLDHADEVQHATAWAYDGAKLFQHPLGVAMTELYDAPYLVVSRRALQAALYDEAIRLGVAVLFGHNVALINTAEPSVTLETGIRIEADLVIGADGERSVCRKAVTGKHIRSNDSGHHIYLITVPNSSVQQAIPDIPLASPPCINFILGPGGHSVTYALPGSGLFHVLVVVKHTDIEDTPSLPHQVPLDIIKAIFQDWVVVKKLAEVATGCIQWTLLDTDLPEIWVKNNTVLVGDAAHAMLPFLGQGAAMALEDAVLLSTLLSRLPTSSEEFDQTILSSLLDEFCKLRYPRVEALKAKSRENGDAYALPTSKGERRTDGSKMETAEISVDVLQAMVSSHFLVNASIRDVLFGYDAETAASGTCSSEVKLG